MAGKHDGAPLSEARRALAAQREASPAVEPHLLQLGDPNGDHSHLGPWLCHTLPRVSWPRSRSRLNQQRNKRNDTPRKVLKQGREPITSRAVHNTPYCPMPQGARAE